MACRGQRKNRKGHKKAREATNSTAGLTVNLFVTYSFESHVVEFRLQSEHLFALQVHTHSRQIDSHHVHQISSTGGGQSHRQCPAGVGEFQRVVITQQLHGYWAGNASEDQLGIGGRQQVAFPRAASKLRQSEQVTG